MSGAARRRERQQRETANWESNSKHNNKPIRAKCGVDDVYEATHSFHSFHPSHSLQFPQLVVGLVQRATVIANNFSSIKSDFPDRLGHFKVRRVSKSQKQNELLFEFECVCARALLLPDTLLLLHTLFVILHTLSSRIAALLFQYQN